MAKAVEKWAGKGEIVPKDKRGSGHRHEFVSESDWSTTYQWLPANLAFQPDGTVRFTSYVNNLHPDKYPGIYRAIESLIDIAIPAWDHALTGQTSTKSTVELTRRLEGSKVNDEDEDAPHLGQKGRWREQEEKWQSERRRFAIPPPT